MVQKLYDEDNVADIADAIREKNDSHVTYKVSEMASAIANLPKGAVTNGIVEQYVTASGTISPGTLVEISPGSSQTGWHGDTVVIDVQGSIANSRVIGLGTRTALVVYVSATNKLIGKVCRVEADGCYVGAETQLADNAYTIGEPCAIQDVNTGYYSDSVFIPYQKGSALYGLVCSVDFDNRVVSFEVEHQIDSTYGEASCIYATAYGSSTKRMLVCYESGGKVSGVICTLTQTQDGSRTTEFSVGSATQLTASGVGANIHVVYDSLSSSGSDTYAYLLASASQGLYWHELAVNGTSVSCAHTLEITSSSVNQVSNVQYAANGGEASAFAYTSGSNNTMRLAFVLSTSQSVFYEGTLSTPTITVQNDGGLYLVYKGLSGGATMDFSVFYCGGVGKQLSSIGAHIANLNTITSDTAQYVISTPYSGQSCRGSGYDYILNYNKVNGATFILHGNASTPSDSTTSLGADSAYTPSVISPASTDTFQGLVKTTCTASTPGDVWVLDTN